jgi:hypothetical protein
MTAIRRLRQTILVVIALGIVLSAGSANASFIVSDLVVFTTPATMLTNPDGTPMDAATFAFTFRCGGPGGASPGILSCFAVPEANANQPGIALLGVNRVPETVANPPGPTLDDATIVNLPAVPAGPGNIKLQLTESDDTTKLSDALSMAFARPAPLARKAGFAFWSDPVGEPAVAPDPAAASMAELDGKFMDLSANLFPGLGGAGQPALPYRVWVMSDCGSTTQQVCTIPSPFEDTPEPSTWLLLSSALVGLVAYSWRRRTRRA